MQIEGYSKVWFYHPDGTEEVNVVIHELKGLSERHTDTRVLNKIFTYQKFSLCRHIDPYVTLSCVCRVGNKKGDIHMRDRQVLVVNFVESTHTYLDAPCGFTIDAGAEIILPTEVIVKGETFSLGGMITGVEYLYIDEGGSFTIIDDAQTGA